MQHTETQTAVCLLAFCSAIFMLDETTHKWQPKPTGLDTHVAKDCYGEHPKACYLSLLPLAEGLLYLSHLDLLYVSVSVNYTISINNRGLRLYRAGPRLSLQLMPKRPVSVDVCRADRPVVLEATRAVLDLGYRNLLRHVDANGVTLVHCPFYHLGVDAVTPHLALAGERPPPCPTANQDEH